MCTKKQNACEIVSEGINSNPAVSVTALNYCVKGFKSNI